MKIIVFCILKLIFISIVSSQSDSPCHVCEYGGKMFEPKVGHPFSASDVLERCDLVTFGGLHIGGEPMKQEDQDGIKALVAAGKPVYTYVGYTDAKRWSELLDPEDQAAADKTVSSLVETIKGLQVTGIILGVNNVYDNVPDCGQKIVTFVTNLKGQLPELKFGLNLVLSDGDSYKKISNKELFDYSVTNSVIDLYFIDLTVHNFACTPELHKSGTILTAADKNIPSVELLSNIISQSTMDKAKTIACINIAALSTKTQGYNSVSEYCSGGGADSPDWCVDNLQRKYDVAALVKKSFAGVAVDWIELDDVQCTCQCKQAYPVTNAIFDGWDGAPLKPCEKLA